MQQALLEDGSIDRETTERLVQAAAAAASAAAPVGTAYCSITFHRAFDCCTTDPLEALETLIRHLAIGTCLECDSIEYSSIDES